ncbi:type II toxin-antitoxin system RelE/ParE family toxin [Nocardiopsis sp. HNM0947]|uniref:Type II toxin-antitoxin system RelE/ParE family toxin n=1 Tax=Nocardiopsis coralli TaxID=2772213 RepID=A0ABR9PBD6_9ACTN|nr:type II toxin-antitoxin system RelE/ParE family toxin [Nocardiopsis coralli]MBE3001150.1 type II toxin-antitoxin system RelE/ParE family toxin [Nocardiopsis coralli]
MSYRTVFRPEARAELRKLPKNVAMKVFRKLTELESDPWAFGTTALVGAPEVRRVRVADYRVIYTVEQGRLIIWVLHVGHRSDIYD